MRTGAAAVSPVSTSSSGTAPSPIQRAAEWTAVALLVTLFALRGLVPAWKQLNSDFPNYFLAARLFVDGAPLERMYDWIWFQRQKDHAGIDWGVVSYGPLTPFSAMVLAPFTGLSALAAKRCWLVLNLALLAGSIALLRSMTKLGLRRVALVTFLTVIPLRTNFDFGQHYVLVLFLVVLAGHSYLMGRGTVSGALVAIAAVLKVYPAILLVFFAIKRRWSALAGFASTTLIAVAVAVATFGWAPLRVYATFVLPRVSAGEVHDPYYLPLSSPTVLLRRLFVAEPDLNPRPLLDAPLAYTFLQPAVQGLVLSFSLWLIVRRRRDTDHDALQWGALVALSLVLSTGASTYHFCVLVLATVVALDALLRSRQVRLALALVVLHALVCAPLYRFVPSAPTGWRVLLAVPRLYALSAYWCVFLRGLAVVSKAPNASRWETPAFGVLFVVLTLSGIRANWQHLGGLVRTYATRVDPGSASLLSTTPAVSRNGDIFTRMGDEGYALGRARAELRSTATRGLDLFHPTVAADADEAWVEVAGRQSGVARLPLHVDSVAASELSIEFADAEQPAVSPDGRWLTFIRQEGGRGSLWRVDRGPRSVRSTMPSAPRRVVDSAYDVLDAAVWSDGTIVLAAARDSEAKLFSTDVAGGAIASLDIAARFPAISPDGSWLAYSHAEHGAWQLEVMKRATRERRRLTREECNSLTPAWTPDGAKIVYASDCGRGLGATALCEMAFVP